VRGWIENADTERRMMALEALQVVVTATRESAVVSGVLPVDAPACITEEQSSRCTSRDGQFVFDPPDSGRVVRLAGRTTVGSFACACCLNEARHAAFSLERTLPLADGLHFQPDNRKSLAHPVPVDATAPGCHTRIELCVESDNSRRIVVMQLHEVVVQPLNALAARRGRASAATAPGIGTFARLASALSVLAWIL